MDRIDPALRVGDRIQADGQILLTGFGMTERAVLQVGGFAGRAHGRVENTGEVMRTSSEAGDGVWLAAGRHDVDAVVNPMDHNGKIDGLWSLTGGPLGDIGVRRIVAEDAVLRIIAPVSMQRKVHVALIAVGFRDYRAAGLNCGAVHGEVEDLIRGSALDLLRCIGVGQDVLQPFGFDADGVSAGGLRRYCVLEGIGAVTTRVALSLRAVLAYVAERGYVAAEICVSIIGGGTGHGELEILERRIVQGDGFAVHVLNRVGDYRFLAGGGVGYACNSDLDTGYQGIRVLRIGGGSVIGHYVRALDGRVEGCLALRNMAVVALRVVSLEAAGVVGPRGEIDIVVASAASRPAGRSGERGGLRGAGGLAMANLATAGIGGIDDCRKVANGTPKADDLVGNARSGLSANHAG